MKPKGRVCVAYILRDSQLIVNNHTHNIVTDLLNTYSSAVNLTSKNN